MNKISTAFFSLFAAVAFGLGVWLIYFQGVSTVRDWYWLRNYDPSEAIVSLANSGTYTDHAKDIFYLTDPELIDANSFNEVCSFTEYTIVLGCYSSIRKIYVFDVDDSRIPSVEEVTAAHEMLHAAFDSLSRQEKDELSDKLTSQLELISEDRVLKLVKLYSDAIFEDEENPSTLENDAFNSELHSIFGTEVADLTPELETHYKQYFEDRATLLELANEYSATFEEIESNIATFDSRLASSSLEINSLESRLNNLGSNLSTEEIALAKLRNNSTVTQYNVAVTNFNRLVDEYNGVLSVYRDKIEEHNNIVKSRNQQSYDQRDLIRAINSKYEPEGPGVSL